MAVLQTHYTSSLKGHGGHAGFDFHSISEGIDPGDREQIRSLGELKLPRDLEFGLELQEQVARAPILLRYRILQSGRWVLVRSRYVGTDYSKLRGGNYFAHSLIGDPEDLRHWPVDFVDWPHWQQRLERDDGQPPPPLDPVDLDDVAPPARLALEALAGFLSADGSRTELLARMIRATLLRAETDRSILIRDPGSQGLTWVACIQKAFPRQAALHLSFCTYQRDVYGTEAINVSVGETDFCFDDMDFRSRFFAFDLIDGRASEIPEVAAEYEAVVAGWMTAAPARLAAFHQFMEDCCDLSGLDDGALQGLRLFRLEQQEIGLPMGGDLEALLGFARDRTRPEGRERILDLLVDRLGAATDLSAGEYGAMIGFLAQTARVTGNPTHRERAMAAWLRMFDRLVAGCGTALEETRAAKTALLALDPGAESLLAQQFVSDEHLDVLYPLLREAESTVLVAVVDELVRQLSVAEPGLAWPDGRGGRFLSSLVAEVRQPEPLLDFLLGACGARPNDLAAAVGLLAEVLANDLGESQSAQAEARLELLGRRLARLGDGARTARERLDRPETHAVLRGDWLERLDTSKDPSSLFNGYRGNDLLRTPVFAEAADAWLRSRYFERLADRPAADQAQRWLLDGELGRLEPAALQRAATLLNERLPMRSKEAAQLAIAEPLAALVAEHELSIKPNRALILTTVFRVVAGKEVEWSDLPRRLGGHLDGLAEKEYRALLEGLLPSALGRCRSYEAHGQCLQALSVAGRRETLLKVYRTTLVHELKDPALLHQAVKCWLVDAADRPGGVLAPEIAEILAAGLTRLKADQRKRLEAEIDKDGTLPDGVNRSWKDLQARADTKRGLLAKLGGSVSRLFRSSRTDSDGR